MNGETKRENGIRFWQVAQNEPVDVARDICCKEGARWAFSYAQFFDKTPRDDTRETACGDAGCAYLYAVEVDQGPRDDTRKAACGDPEAAYLYAVFVDEGEHPETLAAVQNDPMSRKMYRGHWPSKLEESNGLEP